MQRIVFHVGGPAFHPVEEQAHAIAKWLGPGYACTFCDGLDAFAQLDDADLLVLMGLHWTGMAPAMPYHAMGEEQQRAFEGYVASGRPIIAHHGAIASYDDWPRFGELVGFAWIWGTTNHSPVADYAVRVLPTGHPIVAGVQDFQIHDELYYDIAITPGLEVAVHAEAEFDGKRLPMVMTATGGRAAGAGKIAYLANGHDMKAFACRAMETLWRNTVAWALERGA